MSTLNEKLGTVVKELKNGSNIKSVLEVVKGFIPSAAPDPEGVSRVVDNWDFLSNASRQTLKKYFKYWDDEELMQVMTELSGLEIVEAQGMGGRRPGLERHGKGLYPKNVCALVGDSYYNFKTIYSYPDSFVYCKDTEVWKKAGAKLGSVYDYSTNPLDYLDFKSMPQEKCGKYEDRVIYYGVELEVNVKDGSKYNSVCKLVHKDLKTDFVMFKRDGSIGEHGFEIVTAPATLAYHKTAWDTFFNGSSKLLSSWGTDKCGMHVHINREAFTSANHLGKMMAFYNAKTNQDFIHRVAGRASGYAQTNPKCNAFVAKALKEGSGTETGDKPLNAVFKSRRQDEMGYNRNQAINIGNPTTIEVRIFRGNTSKIGFFKNLEFVDSVLEYSKVLRYNPMSTAEKKMHERRLAVGSTGQEMDIYGISFSDYLKWLEKDKSSNYMNLRLWLSKTGIIEGFKPKKYTSSTPKDKVIREEDIVAVA